MGEIIKDKTVQIDGESFRDIEFVNCTIVYAADQHYGTGVDIRDCKFNGCDFKLVDAAADTLAFLTLMSKATGAVPLFQMTFPMFDIRRKVI